MVELSNIGGYAAEYLNGVLQYFNINGRDYARKVVEELEKSKKEKQDNSIVEQDLEDIKVDYKNACELFEDIRKRGKFDTNQLKELLDMFSWLYSNVVFLDGFEELEEDIEKRIEFLEYLLKRIEGIDSKLDGMRRI